MIKRGAKWMTSLAGWFFTLLCSGVILACVAGVLLIRHYSEDLPDYSQLAEYDPPTATRLYANDHRLLAEYATQKRVYVPLSAIPKRVILAFLSAEDKDFYHHPGVDYRGIARAVFKNIKHYGEGRSLVGGSTITQQVVKNFLLTNEKSLERKIKEAILAMRITNAYSKDRILELYLNEIYLGLRSYGVAAAALNYFNKSLDTLTLEEAALLAALPKAPANYDPRKHYERAKERRDFVIERMMNDGHISQKDALSAQAKPITLKKRDRTQRIRAPYFAEEVRRWLKREYGAEEMERGGYTVLTTLNPKLQLYADEALRTALIKHDRARGYRGPLTRINDLKNWQEEFKTLTQHAKKLEGAERLAIVILTDAQHAKIGFEDGSTGSIAMADLTWTRRVMSNGALGKAITKPADVLSGGDVIMVKPKGKQQFALHQIPTINGALVAMDPRDGRVLAMSGGYSGKHDSFNRATQGKRQPGSAFKPFVYASALENGLTPATQISDGPIELSQGVGQDEWKPENFDGKFLGNVTLRRALEKSRNTPTVRLGKTLGVKRIIEMAQRLGIYHQPPENLSIVLGTSETTLMKLVNGYAILAGGGLKLDPELIERIDDRRGKTIWRRDQRHCPRCTVEQINHALTPPAALGERMRLIDKRIAYQVTSLLEGAVQRGTGVRAKVLKRPIAGKTGTTNEARDAWFVGYSPDLVVGVYIGYDIPQSLGRKATGSSVALPVFIDFMQAALKDVEPRPFDIPETMVLTKVHQANGKQVEAWDSPNDKTILEAQLDDRIPIFKPATARELGELGWQAKESLAEYVPPVEPAWQPGKSALPWQQQRVPRPAEQRRPFP